MVFGGAPDLSGFKGIALHKVLGLKLALGNLSRCNREFQSNFFSPVELWNCEQVFFSSDAEYP